MNKRDLQAKRNRVLRLLDPMKKKHINCVALNRGNSFSHERAKAEMGWVCASLGHHFVTEATFKMGGRCDFLCLDTGVIIEVVHSETKESIEKKRKKYPEELKLEVIYT